MINRKDTLKDLREIMILLENCAESTEKEWTRELIGNLRRDFARILRGLR